MRAFKVSKDFPGLSIEEKIKCLDTYDVEDLKYVLKMAETFPGSYDKEVVIAVQNKLFEKGITSL